MITITSFLLEQDLPDDQHRSGCCRTECCLSLQKLYQLQWNHFEIPNNEL